VAERIDELFAVLADLTTEIADVPTRQRSQQARQPADPLAIAGN
jgi:hypothetical protein